MSPLRLEINGENLIIPLGKRSGLFFLELEPGTKLFFEGLVNGGIEHRVQITTHEIRHPDTRIDVGTYKEYKSLTDVHNHPVDIKVEGISLADARLLDEMGAQKQSDGE